MKNSRLNDYIRVYDNALSDVLCDELLMLYKQYPERQIVNGKGKRAGLENSKWTEMNIGALGIQPLQQTLLYTIKEYKKKYESDCNMFALPDPGRYDHLILKEYKANTDECFEVHFDSLLSVSDRYLVLLWYLNDVKEGGETVFVDLDISVKPKKGRFLIFPPYWLFRHKACIPVSDDKYILSTYLLW
ncbi:MAG: hypothetical protein Tsb0027_05800 [Wenzhouxiangellaceae bacterium]